MKGNEIVETYEALSVLTGEMLIAAQHGEWEKLTELEHHCRKPISQLMAKAPGAELNENDQKRKMDIIRKILADDAKIRELVEPRMAKLMQMLQGAGASRKLATAYQNGTGY